jgi:ubiquinone/menaquinone biosynthesis C-methylase UbiE
MVVFWWKLYSIVREHPFSIYNGGMTHARTGNARVSPDAKGGGAHSTHGAFAHPLRNVEALGIEPGMRVADFGSGSGAYVHAIAMALEGSGYVYAVDIQKDLLRRTLNEAHKLGHKNIEVLWGDLEAPGGSKIADEALDLVLVSNLLFQVAGKDALMREAARVLRPRGRLAIIDWTDSFNNMGPHKDEVVTQEEAYAFAQRAGLIFADEFEAGAHHYGLIFRKSGEKHGTIKRR